MEALGGYEGDSWGEVAVDLRKVVRNCSKIETKSDRRYRKGWRTLANSFPSLFVANAMVVGRLVVVVVVVGDAMRCDGEESCLGGAEMK